MTLRPLHHGLADALSPANVHAVAQLAEEHLTGTTDNGETPAAANGRSGKHGARQTDARLLPFVESARNLFAKLRERGSSIGSGAGNEAPHVAAQLHPSAAQPDYVDLAAEAISTLEQALTAATKLPFVASAEWTARSRPILPGTTSDTRHMRTWAPVLAYLLVRHMPVEEFDRLLLRSALGDIFASHGMEGEARWQAAAQVRLLLTPAGTAPNAIHTADLFTHPDARWLAGVNRSGEATYFNKEQFQELLTWLELPALLKLASDPDSDPRAEHTERMETTLRRARHSGYNLDHFLAGTAAPSAPTPQTAEAEEPQPPSARSEHVPSPPPATNSPETRR